MKRKYLIFTAALLLCAVLLRVTWDFWVGFLPECYFYKMTGYYCPGCGGTMAVYSLLHFRLWTAFKYNPGVVCLFFILAAAVSEKLFNIKILPKKLMFWVVFIIILFAYYILRNFTSSLSAL